MTNVVRIDSQLSAQTVITHLRMAKKKNIQLSVEEFNELVKHANKSSPKPKYSQRDRRVEEEDPHTEEDLAFYRAISQHQALERARQLKKTKNSVGEGARDILLKPPPSPTINDSQDEVKQNEKASTRHLKGHMFGTTMELECLDTEDDVLDHETEMRIDSKDSFSHSSNTPSLVASARSHQQSDTLSPPQRRRGPKLSYSSSLLVRSRKKSQRTRPFS